MPSKKKKKGNCGRREFPYRVAVHVKTFFSLCLHLFAEGLILNFKRILFIKRKKSYQKKIRLTINVLHNFYIETPYTNPHLPYLKWNIDLVCRVWRRFFFHCGWLWATHQRLYEIKYGRQQGEMPREEVPLIFAFTSTWKRNEYFARIYNKKTSDNTHKSEENGFSIFSPKKKNMFLFAKVFQYFCFLLLLFAVWHFFRALSLFSRSIWFEQKNQDISFVFISQMKLFPFVFVVNCGESVIKFGEWKKNKEFS